MEGAQNGVIALEINVNISTLKLSFILDYRQKKTDLVLILNQLKFFTKVS